MPAVKRRLLATILLLTAASAFVYWVLVENHAPARTTIQEPRAADSEATSVIIAVDVAPTATHTATPPPFQTRADIASATSLPPATVTPAHDVVLNPVESKSLPEGADSGHVYTAFDFLRDYLTNRTYPIILPGRPWTNSTLNVSELAKPLGGVTYWDFFSEPENWDSPSYMWQDDTGTWRPYQKDTLRAGQNEVTAYQLLDRAGPGVMDKLWFTEDAVWMLTTEQSRRDVGPITNMDDFIEWGNLDKLGNLRIEVDDRVAYDGPLREWISGKSWGLTPELAQILTWRHREFGSSGTITPVLYSKRLRVWVYGGTKKPKWFLATGVRFPASMRLEPFTNTPADLDVVEMTQLARNVSEPEQFVNSAGNARQLDLTVTPGIPTSLQFQGAGTLAAMTLRIAAPDARNMWLRVKYGSDVAINLPLIAFFGDQLEITLHRSTPLGIIRDGGDVLFYSNYPLPFQNGMTIELTTSSATAVRLSANLAVTGGTHPHQLRVDYHPAQKLEMFGPDYAVHVNGDGKLVGIVLETDDQSLGSIPIVYSQPNVEDPVRRAWEMGYLEGNLSIADGSGNSRIYGGQEDWADGGFYFNRGYTSPPGGSNRPFGGILRYRDGKDGYATLFRYFDDLSAFVFTNGLTLSFGHGTWNNNYPVRYGTTVYYYQ